MLDGAFVFIEGHPSNAFLGNDVTGLAFLGADLLGAGNPENDAEAGGAGLSKGFEALREGLGNPGRITNGGEEGMQSLRLIYGQQVLARSPWLAKGAGILSGITEAKALLDLGMAGALELNCALQ